MTAGSSARVGPRAVLACAVAALLAGLVYLNALRNPFVYDDHRTIVGNSTILDLTNERAIVMHDVTRPLVNLSYAIDHRLWGAAPFGFHLTSVVLHALNVALLFVFAWVAAEDRARAGRAAGSDRFGSSLLLAFVAAALFAVHPMMTEAVGYISGRSDVLCATWCLLAILCARRWMREGSRTWWGLSLGLWLASLLTKEIAVAWPILIWGYDRWILGGDDTQRRRRWRGLHAPLLLLAGLACAVRAGVFVMLEHQNGLAAGWRAVPTELVVVGRYIRLLLVPAGQTIFHDVSVIRFGDLRTLGDLAVLGLLIAAATWRRADRLVHFGLVWFLLLLLPSSALAVVGAAGGMAEHRVYLASGGLFLIAGAAIAWLGGRLASASRPLRWLAAGAGAAILLSLSGRTILRNSIWSSPVSLWQEAVSRAPDSDFPHTVLGESLHEVGRHEDAVTEYRTALRIDPDEDLDYLKLGLCLSELGRFDEARAAFETLGRRRPDSTVVTTGEGMVAWLSGDADTARQKFREVMAKDPRDVLSRQWLAVLEEDSGNPAEALRLCREVEQLTPGDTSTEDCIHRNQARVGYR